MYNGSMSKNVEIPVEIKYDGNCLHQRCNGETVVLGKINTLKGRLTKSQKLEAVRQMNQWVRIR